MVFKADSEEHSEVLDRPLDILGHFYAVAEALVDQAKYAGAEDAYREAVVMKSLENRMNLTDRKYSYDVISCSVVNAETQWYVARVKTNEIPKSAVCENADERLTLETCLEQFFTPETLGEEDMVICKKCNERGR